LFDDSRKRPIPFLPQKIGIITSKDGAALRDILTVLKRRFINVEILIYPVKVQGDDAKHEIAEGIRYLNNEQPQLDVLLIGRGGGSMEDLWAFNEEVVARAIASSKIPTISCVGHEIDFTIADFVADLRAPTPSAAAELVVKNKHEFVSQLDNYIKQLKSHLVRTTENLEHKLISLANSRVFTQPLTVIEEKIQQVDDFSGKINNSLKHLVELKLRDMRVLSEKLNVLSPLNILSRGYAITWKLPDRRLIRSVNDVIPGDTILIKVSDGELETQVTKKE
jgi:exodeoxyribonuclease VII large subunit